MGDEGGQVLEYARVRRRRRRFVGIIAGILLLYLGGYVALRAGHVVMHYHDMEGDYVGAAMGMRAPGLAVFSPLMWVEERLWRLRR